MQCVYPIAGHTVYRFSMPVLDSSMYMIPEETSCLIVDPCICKEAEELLRKLGIQTCVILLTHEHFDHISGVNRLRELLPCQVICSKACAGRVGDARKNGAAYFEAMFIQRNRRERNEIDRILDARYTCRADQTYSGQTELVWKDLTLTLTETPGHSPGSQAIEIGKRWYFTGDSLIPGQRVITRLPGGSRRDFTDITYPYLAAIAPGSILFPGHGPEAVFSGQLEE